MAKGHRSQIKRERNEQKDMRPKAHAKFVRVSSTKAKIVLDQIKGKDVVSAAGILSYSPRYASDIILKVLKSAIANAENNQGMDPAKLFVEEAIANQGPTMKRIRPESKGRAYKILKKTSHISIVLNEK
jgi:large subunit ribosomal protein L22